MKIRRFGSFMLSICAATVVAASTAALAAGDPAASLQDGRVHGFSGCLTQEPAGIRYFDLTKAKSDDGKELGTVRLTSSVWGIHPKQSVDRPVHVNGMYRGHMADDPVGGHVAVKDAVVTGDHCS